MFSIHASWSGLLHITASQHVDVDFEDGRHEDDGTEEAGANAGRPSWSAATRWLIVRPCGLRFFSFGWPLLLLLLLVEPRAEALRGRMLRCW